LNFSVTPSCCNCQQLCISVPPSRSTRSHRQGQDIYTDGSNFGNSSKTSSPARVLLCRLGSPDCLLVTSDLPPLVSATVNGNPPLRCRRSEVIANCLIDARAFVHALPHISFAILLCEHVGCIIFFIRGHPFVVLIVWSFLLPNGWTRIPKYSL